jgi:hypothetical protein
MNTLKQSRSSQRSGIGNPSGKGALYKRFFDRLIDELRDKDQFTKAEGGAPKNWHTFSSGTRGFTYAIAFPADGRIRAELYIDLGKPCENKAAFEILQADGAALSKSFVEPIQWELLKEKQACRVGVYRPGSIEDSTKSLEEYHRWAVQRLLLLKSVFGPRLRGLAREAEKRATSTPWSPYQSS